MCGIIGFVGDGDVLEHLTVGLGRLEYRGYDSVGVAYFDSGKLRRVRTAGRLPSLVERLRSVKRDGITCGIGHTRWATHGAVSEINSHPHGNGRVYGVHNGIIENSDDIESFLASRGYSLESDTDTERAVLLFDCLHKDGRSHIKAMTEGARLLRGSFAIVLLFADSPDTLYAQRRDSPLLICRSSEGYYASSDISAPMADAVEYTLLEDGEVAVVTKSSATFYDSDGALVEKHFAPAEREDCDSRDSSLDGFEHYMLREIYEQPAAAARALGGHIVGSLPSFDATLSAERLRSCECIHIVGCGTAMHAGLFGKDAIERMARVRVTATLASEFRIQEPIFKRDDIVLAISQSGETADTLAAMRLARSHGIFTLALVNVPTSTMAREADAVIHMRAGAELSVASTKAYTVQCTLLYLFAVWLALVNGNMSRLRAVTLCDSLMRLPQALEYQLKLAPRCRELAERYLDAQEMFFIGRGQDLALALEAALKMKEITYRHSEACAAGELKHGTISLIARDTVVLAFVTDTRTVGKMAGNIAELAARGARIILISPPQCREHIDCAEHIPLAESMGELSLLCGALVAQLMAYYTAVALGRDVDRPRNLAKAVTVE